MPQHSSDQPDRVFKISRWGEGREERLRPDQVNDPKSYRLEGYVSANSATLTCVGCDYAHPLWSCNNCGHDIRWVTTAYTDQLSYPKNPPRGYPTYPAHGKEGYVGCPKCEMWWNRWTCEFCEAMNNSVHRSIDFKSHVHIEPWKKPSSSSCFIATAVYGTAFTEEVQLLRRFRDEKLKHWRYGKSIIQVYQRGSPPLANWISDKPKVRLIARKFLLSPVVWVVSKIMEPTKELRR